MGTKPFRAATSAREYQELIAACPTLASARFQLRTRAATSRIGRPASGVPTEIAGRLVSFMDQAEPTPSAELTTRVHRVPRSERTTVTSWGRSSMRAS